MASIRYPLTELFCYYNISIKYIIIIIIIYPYWSTDCSQYKSLQILDENYFICVITILYI